ncbi:MAG: type II secretion system inner membrane protein GspF [Sphingopyxis sp.]
MAEFRYLAIDPRGQEKRGAISAETRDAAQRALAARKLYVVECVAGTGHTPAKVPLLRLRRTKLSHSELALFTRQLATLTAVSPLEEALRTTARQSEAVHVRAIISTVHGGVVEGRRLADAMAREPKSFPPLYRAMVAAGESSGALGTILDRLSALLERQAEVRGKLIATLAYPVVLAFVALAVIAALMIWVVPKVVEQFDTVGQQLPLLTRIIIALSRFAANWWWAVLIGLAAVGALGTWLLRRPGPRLVFDGWLLRLPLLGRLIRNLHAARFARTLGTMVASRLPLVEGLGLTIPTIRNAVLAGATATLREAVRSGGSLSSAMRSAAVFPPLLVYLTASGESSGRLDTMLESAATYLENEFDRFTTTAMALLEPLIIVVMGVIVALIILAILLPILQLQQLTGA